jgi:secreted trypsin-like serine protease
LPTDSVKSVTVSIYSYDDDCTGVKVAPRFILTARHCRINDTTRVIFPGDTRYKITGYFEPSRKPESAKNERDLAILKIEAAVPGPVAGLADDRSTPEDGTTAWMAGYGGQKPSRRNDSLRKIQVKMVDRSYSLSAVMVQTTERSAVCDGDSGGPGYTERDNQIVVWGIDSAPLDGNSTCSKLEVFAKVASEHDWIKRTISDEQWRATRF